MRMQNKCLVFLFAAVLSIPFSLTWAQETTKGKTIKFSLAHIYTPKSWNETYAIPPLFKLVEKHTKGKYILNIAYYPAGTLLAPPDIYGGVTKGIADIGWSYPGLNPGMFPVVMTLGIPGIAPPSNAYVNTLTWWEFYNKFKPKEFNDVKMLLWCGVGPGWVHSKKPIRSAEDFNGLKVSCSGYAVGAFKALGAEPIGLSSAELYLAASKGVIDASLIPIGAVRTYKLDEVYDYSTCVPQIYNQAKYCVMNWNKWNALPKDLQAAFDAVAEEAVKTAGRVWDHFESPITMKEYLPKTHEIIYLPDTEAAKLRGLMKPLRNKQVVSLNEKGFPGEEIVSQAEKIMEKNNKKTFETWEPPAK